MHASVVQLILVNTIESLMPIFAHFVWHLNNSEFSWALILNIVLDEFSLSVQELVPQDSEKETDVEG